MPIWKYPLVGNITQSLPKFGHPNSFAAIRKHDIHTGIDLFAPEGQYVVACEEGKVCAIIDFTGNKADSPWWLDTKAIYVRGSSGTIVYGEVEPTENLSVGSAVKQGQVLGNVKRVLKKDKGLPLSMLHLELWFGKVTDSLIWNLNSSRPKGLIDPTGYLENTWQYQVYLGKQNE
jgi:murein DD-endopeptidase MepM/ murein hydrolase activator NlpD